MNFFLRLIAVMQLVSAALVNLQTQFDNHIFADKFDEALTILKLFPDQIKLESAFSIVLSRSHHKLAREILSAIGDMENFVTTAAKNDANYVAKILDIAMDYKHLETIREIIADGRLPTDKVLEISSWNLNYKQALIGNEIGRCLGILFFIWKLDYPTLQACLTDEVEQLNKNSSMRWLSSKDFKMLLRRAKESPKVSKKLILTMLANWGVPAENHSSALFALLKHTGLSPKRMKSFLKNRALLSLVCKNADSFASAVFTNPDILDEIASFYKPPRFQMSSPVAEKAVLPITIPLLALINHMLSKFNLPAETIFQFGIFTLAYFGVTYLFHDLPIHIRSDKVGTEFTKMFTLAYYFFWSFYRAYAFNK